MKKKNLKFKKYLKSKKGFSLLELVCAIMIMGNSRFGYCHRS